jgi:hypothetical protein
LKTLVLPREALQSREIKHLHIGLGKKPPFDLQGVSFGRPKHFRPENDNAVPAGDRNGEVGTKNAAHQSQPRDNSRSFLRLARLIFRELKNDDGHVHGLEARP